MGVGLVRGEKVATDPAIQTDKKIEAEKFKLCGIGKQSYNACSKRFILAKPI